MARNLEECTNTINKLENIDFRSWLLTSKLCSDENYELISADELTTKYNELFSLTMDEAIGFVQGLDGNQNLEAMVNAQKTEMENFFAKLG